MVGGARSLALLGAADIGKVIMVPVGHLLDMFDKPSRLPFCSVQLGMIKISAWTFQVNGCSQNAIEDALAPQRRLKPDSVLVGMSIVSISRGMCRAQVTAAFATQRICVRSWQSDETTGTLPTWLCPFFPQPIEKPADLARSIHQAVSAPVSKLSPVSVQTW